MFKATLKKSVRPFDIPRYTQHSGRTDNVSNRMLDLFSVSLIFIPAPTKSPLAPPRG